MGTVLSLAEARQKRSLRLAATREPRLTTRELCEVLNVSESTVKRWRANGLPHERWGPRLYRYVLSDVEAWRG